MPRSLSFRLRVAAALTLVGLLLISFSSAAEPSTRSKEIADLEKQLRDLELKLAELKKGDASPTLRPLQLSDAATWRGVRGTALSPDGKWFGYRVGPAEGDGEVVLRATTGDKET